MDSMQIQRSGSSGVGTTQMKKAIRALEVGVREADVLKQFDYRGVPFSVHPTVNFGEERVLLGVASPRFCVQLQRGDVVSIAFGVEWASIARTGYAVQSKDELTGENTNIIEDFYFP
jgi:hypothetical protein